MKPSKPKYKYITIGRILSPWQFDGRLKVEVITDFPERFAPLSEVYINQQRTTIEAVEWRRGRAIIKLSNINNVKDAEKLRGKMVEIHPRQLHSLSEGEYYHFELIGLKVQTSQGEILGRITEILTFANNDTYIVSGTDGEILIPAVDEIIKFIDLDKKVLVIEPIKGLLSLNKKAV